MTPKSCKGRKLSGILSLLVILSISLAVLAALSPAVSAGIDSTSASVYPEDLPTHIGYPVTVTLTVNGTVNETEKVPVDVMHVIDTSGSMGWYGDVIYNSSGTLNSAWTNIGTFNVDSSIDTFDVLLETGSGSTTTQYLKIKSPSGVWYGCGNTSDNYPLNYIQNTYHQYDGADYIGIYNSDDVESGLWEVHAIGYGEYDYYYDLTVQVPPIRLDAAKDGAKTFVGLRGDDDQIGVVYFDSIGKTQKGLTLLDKQAGRDSVNSKIDSLEASGAATAIGDGIYVAKEELSKKGRVEATKVMVLLSGSVNTTGSNPSTRAQEAADANITIFTVGFGEADHELLQDIADITEGEYYYAANGSDLQGIYETISEEITAMISCVHVYYVLPEGIEYADSATIEPDIIGNTLIWAIGDFGPYNSWNVSFDLYPPEVDSIPANISLNVVRYSRVIYETPGEGDNLVTAGSNIKPGTLTLEFVVMSKGDLEEPFGNLEFHDHAMDINLHSESMDLLIVANNTATSSGTARVNGTSGYNFTVHVEDKKSGDTFAITITGPDGFEYTANGTYTGQGINIHKYSAEILEFPALFMDVTACGVDDVHVYPSGGLYIGQPVDITGYAEVNNPGSEVDVSVKLCVDYYPAMGYTTGSTMGKIISKNISTVNAGETSPSINVSATWIPMSSGNHSISIYVHQLKADGTEFWIDAQGPNNETKYKTIYIKKVKKVS